MCLAGSGVSVHENKPVVAVFIFNCVLNYAVDYVLTAQIEDALVTAILIEYMIESVDLIFQRSIDLNIVFI
jgi:hypothetical protein